MDRVIYSVWKIWSYQILKQLQVKSWLLRYDNETEKNGPGDGHFHFKKDYLRQKKKKRSNDSE